MFTTLNALPEPTRALRSPALCEMLSETWRALAKGVPAICVGPVVLLVVAGLATVSIRSSAGARIRHISDASTLDARSLAVSDARDLVRMDSDKG